MPDSLLSDFGLTNAEFNQIDAALKVFSQRFNVDDRDDAVADGWVAVLTFNYDKPPPGWPAGKPRREQVQYLISAGCLAGCKFVDRFAYDAPKDGNGTAQTHRVTHHIPE